MPANKRRPWLICYDVADPTRLQRVYKEVRRHFTPFQHSVFRTCATRRELLERLGVLDRLIDPRRDDIRAYPLLTTSTPVVYGKGLMAVGVWLADGAL